MIKFVDLQPHGKLRRELDAAYERVMSSGRYIGGVEVEAFEQEWAEYVGVDFCVGCTSGFDALWLILRALDVHMIVSIPSWTAIPTWSAALAAGCNLVPDKKTSIMIIVHLYGSPAISPERTVIEDAAQAHGMPEAGKLGIAAGWSFYPTKNLGAYGDAGAVTTNDAELAERVRVLGDYATLGGINSRLDPLQAAFLRVKLPYLDSWNERRREIAFMYLDGLRDVPGLKLPADHPSAVWHQFVVQTPQRDELRAYLAAHDVETMIHYPVPPHRALGLNFDLPQADLLAARVLSLPIGPHLTDEDVKQVIEQCRHWLVSGTSNTTM